MHTFLLIAIAAAASANPLAHEARSGTKNNAALCSSVNKVVTSYKQEAVATKFCSSFLSLPPRVTTTVTNSDSPPVTSTYTSTVTCMKASPIGVRKRQINERNSEPKPSCYNSFTKPAQISTACSCLSIPTGPTTTTVSSTTTETVTVAAAPTAFGIMAVNFEAMHCLKVAYNAPFAGFQADGNPIKPSLFSLENGQISTNDTGRNDNTRLTAYQSGDKSKPAVLFYQKGKAPYGYVPLSCKLNYLEFEYGTCELDCVGNSGGVDSICFDQDAPGIEDAYCLGAEARQTEIMVRANPR